MTLLQPSNTCWQVAHADRAALLIDNQSYYTALMSALDEARSSIFILGWAFDPRTRLAPDGTEAVDDRDEIGQRLVALSRSNQALDVKILAWHSPFGVNGHQDFFGHRAHRAFKNTPVTFREARDVPFGASHHQKIVIIDNQIAFCGGGDIVTNRWDTRLHLSADPRRILPNHARHPARHEVTMLVDGEAAAALGFIFRRRWSDATGEALESREPDAGDRWPTCVSPDFLKTQIGIARTQPCWRGRPLVEEVRRLTLKCIAGARQSIFLENQYLTCREVVVALAARLREQDGPEIVIILNRRAPSWFDRLSMDSARKAAIRLLRAADAFGRLQIVYPCTSAGGEIVVHSKVSVFDDRIVRVGSANLNNRSTGFDTECDVAIEAKSDVERQAISRFRDVLLSHYMSIDPEYFACLRYQKGGLIPTIAELNDRGRLRAFETSDPSCWETFVFEHALGDPSCPQESWRLRMRRSQSGAAISGIEK
jgi:phosphatidylserine/phosphatidylglycerophosphate/cardiolipin synthase-like enzyme